MAVVDEKFLKKVKRQAYDEVYNSIKSEIDELISKLECLYREQFKKGIKLDLEFSKNKVIADGKDNSKSNDEFAQKTNKIQSLIREKNHELTILERNVKHEWVE